MNSPPSGAAGQRHGFRLQGLLLVPPAGVLCEWVQQLPLYPVPRSSARLAGLLNLRGAIVPVFDPTADATLPRPGGLAPGRCTALVMGREAARCALLLAHPPELLDLQCADSAAAPAAHPLAPFLGLPWRLSNGAPELAWTFLPEAAFARWGAQAALAPTSTLTPEPA